MSMRVPAVVTTLLAASVAPAATFTPVRQLPLQRGRAAQRGGVSMETFAAFVTSGQRTDAAKALAAGQAETIASIRAAIPDMEAKADQSWPPGAQTVAGAPAVLEAFDAPGPPNVAWVSSLNIDGKHSSLTILNGPLTDVPHFVSRCMLNEDNTFSFFMDWRPRADGGYAMRKPDGSYPGPDELGREAFTYSGARDNLGKKFYTPELEAFCEATIASIEGATAGASTSESDVETRGPLAIDLVGVPLTSANLKAVIDARKKAAEFWLEWQLDVDTHGHRPGAPVNSQYVFDSPKKQAMYSALLGILKAQYGDDGVNLAAADSGPLDEGYVGGGS